MTRAAAIHVFFWLRPQVYELLAADITVNTQGVGASQWAREPPGVLAWPSCPCWPDPSALLLTQPPLPRKEQTLGELYSLIYSHNTSGSQGVEE